MGLVNRHRIWQAVIDAGLVALAWYLAFYLRFDTGVPRIYDRLFERTILLVVGIQVVTFVVFGFSYPPNVCEPGMTPRRPSPPVDVR